MSDHMLQVERKLSDAFLDKLMKKAPTVYGVSDWFSVPYQEDGIHWHRLDIHFPTEQHHPLPAILYLHGGGWSTGDKAFFRRNGRLCELQHPSYDKSGGKQPEGNLISASV